MKTQYLYLFAVSLLFVSCSDTGKKAEIKPPWKLSLPKYGDLSGRTSIDVVFPKEGRRLPLTFGIPLGQVQSDRHVVLTDENGSELPASFIPLGNWTTQPARWVLVSTVLNGLAASPRRLTLTWGEGSAPAVAGTMRHTVVGSKVRVDNGLYTLVLSPAGIDSLVAGGRQLNAAFWRPSITTVGRNPCIPHNGTMTILYDTPVYKKIRFSELLADSLELEQEYDLYDGSPLVRCSVRYINRSLSDKPLDSISPLELSCPGADRVQVGLSGRAFRNLKRFSIHQQAFRCYGILDDMRGSLPHDQSTDVWASLVFAGQPDLLLVFPYFRGMAAGDKELESVFSYDGRTVRVDHYRHIATDADVRLRGTMARTFTYWLVVNPPRDRQSILAETVCDMPYVVYDREHLTQMGAFQERSVSGLYDKETLEGALYFTRARVPRAEYPRCGRGTEPGDDGEGLYEVNLHAGGMVFGEVFQYFTPKPGDWHFKHYRDTLGIDVKNIKTGGKFSYRNGDIPLALFQEYLRTGNYAVYTLARLHTQLYADYAISHAAGASEGIGHYYCDWYGNPYVYERFEGLLLGYLVTGDPWLMETARTMADFTIRAWKDGHPRDATLDGTLTGVESRSAYIAKMDLTLYDLSGDRKYLDAALRLADWAMDTQEPEGWWVMDPNDRTASRANRCTPIFAGYVVQGLWPLYWRTEQPNLRQTLLKAADWYLMMQEDARGSNPGTFPNSYWYGTNGSEAQPISPISGNYATTTHAANALLQAYLATERQDYFYAANAAWLGVVNNLTPEGGVPLENTQESSVWSHVMIESLPQFAAVAGERRFPVVLSTKTGIPGTSFMGKGATYDGSAFRFEVKYCHNKPVPARVYFPAGNPGVVTIDGGAVKRYDYDEHAHIVSFELPPSEDFRVCKVTVSR